MSDDFNDGKPITHPDLVKAVDLLKSATAENHSSWAPTPHKAYEIRRVDGTESDLGAEEFILSVNALVAKSRALVALLDDAEVNHGSLVGTATMRGRDELRQELSKWSK